MARPKMHDKSKHAAAQARYNKKKQETHQRVAVWVPKKSVSYFLKAFGRMKKKWDSLN